MKFARHLLLLIAIISSNQLWAQTDDAPSLVKQAVQLNKEGKYADAVEKYRQALKLDSNNVYANYGMAFSLLASGKGNEGIPYAEKVTRTDSPIKAWAYDILGSIYDKDHNSSKAIEAYNKGIKIDSTYQQLYYNLGLVYFRDKKYAEAQRYAEKAIRLDPKHSGSQRMYALVCFHQDKRANALLGLCSFILLDPKSPRNAEAFGNIQHILQGGALKAEPGAAPPKIDANTAALNQAIVKAVADAGKEKHVTAADLLAAQLTDIFNTVGVLADKQTGDNFFKTYFADYFAKLAQSPNMPAFARLVNASTPESADWIKNNAVAMQALEDWVKRAGRGF